MTKVEAIQAARAAAENAWNEYERAISATGAARRAEHEAQGRFQAAELAYDRALSAAGG